MKHLKYTVDTLKQRDLERWNECYRALGVDSEETPRRGRAAFRRAIVEAAVSAGWIEGESDPAAILDWTAKEVHEVADVVDKLYESATEIDPNS